MLRSFSRPSVRFWPTTARYATDALHPVVAALRTALKQSMMARTTDRTGVIKSVLADLQNASHSAGKAPSPIKTLQSAISRRVDAAQTFATSNPPRLDLKAQYEQEAEMLRGFMPKRAAQMTPEQLDKIVKEVLTANDLKKAQGKDVGRIISLVREQTGERAEAKDVAEAVRRIELS